MQDKAIEAFWKWWPSAAARVAQAVTEQAFGDELADELSGKVRAIHPALEWQLGPGIKAKHALCVSPKGNPQLRVLTERWLQAAPKAGKTWEFHPARRRRSGSIGSGLVLDIDDHSVGFADFLVALKVDKERERIDGTYFHPSFSRMTDKLQRVVTFLMLDATLGEDDVERWLGSIEIAPKQPEGAVPISRLPKAVERLAKKATGKQFVVLRGEAAKGKLVFITANRALKRIDHLLLDMHVQLEVKVLEPDGNALPGKKESEALNSEEDKLTKALGKGAVFLGRETRQARRVLHFFAAKDPKTVQAIERWMKQCIQRAPKVSWKRDPDWKALHAWG